MTVYVDKARNPYRRMIMCHMISDNISELFSMAEAIGMRASWFQPSSFPHFDVCQMRRRDAILKGAVEVSRKELVHHMRSYRSKLDDDSNERRLLDLLIKKPSFVLASSSLPLV